MSTPIPADQLEATSTVATYHLSVDGIPSSPNVARCWQARAREAKRFREAVAKQARVILAERGGRSIERARVSYAFIKPRGCPMDPDNALAATKPLTDGLARASGLIVDDSPAHIEFAPVAHERGPVRRVSILVEEVTSCQR